MLNFNLAITNFSYITKLLYIIFKVTANVLMNGSVSTDSAKDEEEAQEFKDFIQNIKPSDFERLMKDNKDFDLPPD